MLHAYISNRNNNMIYAAASLGKCGGLSLAWLLAFTKSLASLDIDVFGLLSI